MKTLVAAAVLAAALLAAAPARAEGPNLSAAGAMDGLRLSFALTQAAAEVETSKTVFGLPRNIGTADRIVRGVLAAALVGVGAYGLSEDDAPSDGASYALLGAALIPAATAATGYCPLYQALGIDTN